MASLIKVMESSISVLKDHFDKGVADGPFKVCTREDCPNRTEEKVDGDNMDKRVDGGGRRLDSKRPGSEEHSG